MMLEYLYTFGFQGSFLSRTMSEGFLLRGCVMVSYMY